MSCSHEDLLWAMAHGGTIIIDTHKHAVRVRYTDEYVDPPPCARWVHEGSGAPFVALAAALQKRLEGAL